jgi:protein-disulfide isomerase
MDQNQFSKPLVVAATAISLAAGIAVGHVIPSPTAVSDTEAAAEKPVPGAPEGPSRRFKIPVTDSQPSEGPANALVTIVQWCDLPDNGCSGMEPAIRSVLERDPKFIRLVFRHYPHSKERMSVAAHQFARAAFEQGGNAKFWKVREKLLGMLARPTMDDLERIAGELGLDWKTIKLGIEKQAFGHVVGGDGVFASMFDVEGSNAIFVNGRPIEGEPSVSKLKALVEEELKAAVKLLAQGVPQEEVYAELTKSGVWNRPDLRVQ